MELLDHEHHFHLKYLLVLVFLFCSSVQTVYISDAEMNLAEIKFWGGLKVLTYSSLECCCFFKATAEKKRSLKSIFICLLQSGFSLYLLRSYVEIPIDKKKKKKLAIEIPLTENKLNDFKLPFFWHNRPFPHYAPVSKHIDKEVRTRLGWTISYKSLYFVHPSLELVPLFTGVWKKSVMYGGG